MRATCLTPGDGTELGCLGGVEGRGALAWRLVAKLGCRDLDHGGVFDLDRRLNHSAQGGEDSAQWPGTFFPWSQHLLFLEPFRCRKPLTEIEASPVRLDRRSGG